MFEPGRYSDEASCTENPKSRGTSNGTDHDANNLVIDYNSVVNHLTEDSKGKVKDKVVS